MEIIESISFGYSGTRIHFVDNSVIVFIYANSLKFINIQTGISKNFIGLGKGITAFCVNKKTGRFAYSEKSNNPSVYVLTYPENKLGLTFQGTHCVSNETLID